MHVDEHEPAASMHPQQLMLRFRIATLIFGSSALLWVPCGLLSVSFFNDDFRYRATLQAEGSGASLMSEYRAASEYVDGAEAFTCQTRHHQVILTGAKYAPRDLALVALQQAESSARTREMVISGDKYRHIVRRVDALGLSLLRRARRVRELYDASWQSFSDLNESKIRPYCEEQDARRGYEAPPLPPLDINDEVRALLLRAADDMDEAVAAYAEVRPWLLVFFYAWIAYSILGLLCAIYVLRLTRPYGEAMRAAREAADLPPW